MKTIHELCDAVRQTACEVQLDRSSGHPETGCEHALAHRLKNLGLNLQQQYPLKGYDEDGTEIGDYCADPLADHRPVAEWKAAKAIADEHVAPRLGYLKAGGIGHGPLIHLRSFRFQVREYGFGNAPGAEAEDRSGGSWRALVSAISVFFRGQTL